MIELRKHLLLLLLKIFYKTIHIQWFNRLHRAREINKAHTTFIDTILKYSHKGRIHAEINQLRGDNGGTVTGRFHIQTLIFNKFLQEIRNLDQ